ncbi:fibronectin type III domain-containing protein [Patescibacteria group bacterium]|nr:fibronectin type III domain-containing protein [Patescibacteria group bacterium]MBU1931095.1 fibronectin type III domain-containing protein [Patescibacteria group bacterium]
MKKTKRIPTMLALLILIAGVALGVFLVQKQQIFNPRANINKSPMDVKITNVSDNSFTVSWKTQDPTVGYVVWGTKENALENIAKDNSETKSQLHYIQVAGLSPMNSYSFKLASDNQTNLYDNHGQAYKITTGPKLNSITASDTISGIVLDNQGIPAQNAIIYLTITNGQATSTQVKATGNWLISLNTIRTESLQDWVKYDLDNTIIDLSIQSEEAKANVVTTTGCARPVPNVTLGKTYDFRELCGQTNQAASTPITPTPTTQPTPLPTPAGLITIENPSFDGETINTNQPQFYGTTTNINKVPAGTIITIKVESDQVYTDSIIVDDNGEWQWSLPADAALETGEHIITLSFIDEDGEEQTIRRNFIVASASESQLPAFEASPSAETSASPTPTATPSLTPTPTSTPTPTATPTASASAIRTSMPSTEAGVPDSGYLTPTLLLSIIGIGLFITGFFSWTTKN